MPAAAAATGIASGLSHDIALPTAQTVAGMPAASSTAVIRGPAGLGQMMRPAASQPAAAAAAATTIQPVPITAAAGPNVYDSMVQPMLQALPAVESSVVAQPTVGTANLHSLASAQAAAVTSATNLLQQQQTLQQQQQVLTSMLQQSATDQQLLLAQSQKRALEQQVQQQQQQLQAIEQQLQQQEQLRLQQQAPSAAKAGLFSSLRAQQEEVSQFAEKDAQTAASTTTSTVGASMYGIDQNVIDQILNDPTSKYHNSKFIKLISQIRSGQVKFVDDQIVPVTLEDLQKKAEEVAAEEGWADEDDVQEFDTSNFHAYDDYEYTPEEEAKVAEEALRRTHDWINQWKEAYGVSPDLKEGQEDEEDVYLNTKEDAERMWREYIGADGDSQESKEPTLPTSIADLIVRAQERIRKGNVILYDFSQESPFLQEEDPLKKGLEYLEADQLALAIQAFEAAVQKDSENSEAWYLLGNANNQFAAAEQAQAALYRCIELDPYHLPALVLLSVSLINSNNLVKALEYLKLWIKRNPEYQGKVDLSALEAYEQLYADDSSKIFDPQGVDQGLLAEVVKVFQAATKVNPNDAELYNVLGLLFHVSQDYDLATEAFQNAVRLNPSDHQLWNRLGATLATNGHPLEALKAYDQALQFRPNNVRLLSNRVVAFYNARDYESAIKAALQTLVINREQSMMWDYLRSCLFRIDRTDLLELIAFEDPNVFRAHFDF